MWGMCKPHVSSIQERFKQVLGSLGPATLPVSEQVCQGGVNVLSKPLERTMLD